MEEKGKKNWFQLLRVYGTVIAAFLIVTGFSVLSPDSFASLDNAVNISRQISFLVIIALGSHLGDGNWRI